MLVEASGIPLAVEISGANKNDFKLVRQTFENIQIIKPSELKSNVCMDKGYDYREVREIIGEFGFLSHIKARGEEAKEIKKYFWKKARRWVVERTHSWMNRFRGILIRWCKKAENYLAMLQFVCGIITWQSPCVRDNLAGSMSSLLVYIYEPHFHYL